MFKKVSYQLVIGLSILVLLLSACAGPTKESVEKTSMDAYKNVETVKSEEVIIVKPHKDLNQEPVPLEIKQDGKDVYVKMTAQITDIEIEPGDIYKAWTLNGEAPGPLIVVEEGDILHFEI